MNKIYEYLKKTYKEGEPIFIEELVKLNYAKNTIRQTLKTLTDKKLINRLSNGIYYMPYTTILGEEGRVSVEEYLRKKYLERNDRKIGYITGLQLANESGFTTQNAAFYEITTNNATTKQRKETIDQTKIIIYKPVAVISPDNLNVLQFLDLVYSLDKYSELTGNNLKNKLYAYINTKKINFNIVKKYLPLYPDKIYKNIYNGGIMRELV